MIYLASPYSHSDPLVRKTRFLMAERFVLHMMETRNYIIFSPIVYGHKFAVEYGIDGSAQFWHVFNTNMIRRSETFFLLKLDGWETSQGVQLEIKMANLLKIPIIEFDHNFNNMADLEAKFMIEQ